MTFSTENPEDNAQKDALLFTETIEQIKSISDFDPREFAHVTDPGERIKAINAKIGPFVQEVLERLTSNQLLTIANFSPTPQITEEENVAWAIYMYLSALASQAPYMNDART